VALTGEFVGDAVGKAVGDRVMITRGWEEADVTVALAVVVAPAATDAVVRDFVKAPVVAACAKFFEYVVYKSVALVDPVGKASAGAWNKVVAMRL